MTGGGGSKNVIRQGGGGSGLGSWGRDVVGSVK